MTLPINESEVLDRLKNWIETSAHSVLITGHKDPDIDAIGSCLAFQTALNTHGITSTVWFEDTLETYATHLPNSNTIQQTLP